MGGKRRGHTVVVTADLESLITAHEETDAASGLVLEEAGVSSTALSPLLGG